MTGFYFISNDTKYFINVRSVKIRLNLFESDQIRLNQFESEIKSIQIYFNKNRSSPGRKHHQRSATGDPYRQLTGDSGIFIGDPNKIVNIFENVKCSWLYKMLRPFQWFSRVLRSKFVEYWGETGREGGWRV